MGLLSSGSALDWPETKIYADYVRKKGVDQFIWVYNHLRNRSRDVLLWGDEIEYILIRHDRINRSTRLHLDASNLQKHLSKEELEQSSNGNTNPLDCLWRPEYAEYMIEGLPGRPFGHLLAHFNLVEANMRRRREIIESNLPPDCHPLTMSIFPRLGCKEFVTGDYKPDPIDGASCSLFFPDSAITHGHPRFSTLTRNIRSRRGEKVVSNVPIFIDINTPRPFIEDFEPFLPKKADFARKCTEQALPDHIYLDAMGFGMGCCCLQVTFQAWCLEEARCLYDQLAPLTPILMALSASSPIIRGYLLDTDCRWKIISDLTDDRTAEERGLKPLKNDRFVIAKSRYDSISSYISEMGCSYSDLKLPIDHEAYTKMRDAEIDHLLSQHIAHLFIRDPIAVYKQKVISEPAEGETDHFENIQSTNWQSLRFKPPPPNSPIGWRVEFRSMELQLTDFENAAFVVFIVLLTRTILTFKLNNLIPLSCVDENMRRAIKRDASRSQKFYFRRGDILFTEKSPVNAAKLCSEIRQRKRTVSASANADSLCQGCCTLNIIPESECCKIPFMDEKLSSDLNSLQDTPKRKVNSTEGSKTTSPSRTPSIHLSEQAECKIKPQVAPSESFNEMSMNEIINGSDSFPGLIPLIQSYLSLTEHGDVDTMYTISQYLDFISRKASGELLTTASWMREQVVSHPQYQQDSVVSEQICFDLMETIVDVSQGRLQPEKLFTAHVRSRSRVDLPHAMVLAEELMDSKRLTSQKP